MPRRVEAPLVRVAACQVSLQVGATDQNRAAAAAYGHRGDQASTCRDELLLADCDLSQARDKSTGPPNDAHADRRPDLYR